MPAAISKKSSQQRNLPAAKKNKYQTQIVLSLCFRHSAFFLTAMESLRREVLLSPVQEYM